jgi:multimeric flavodoxin WrbA
MKKVTAFIGSARKGHTYDAVVQFLSNLQSLGDVEYEIVRLSDYRLGACKGCRLCMDKGEDRCPLKDDREVLIAKMMESDGVIFASPNYSFQVSALMKLFLDRLGFAFHRPRFFGKTFTSIVTEGIYGGNKIVDYLDFVGYGLGFRTVKGSCHNTRDPITEKQQRKMDRVLTGQAQRYYAKLAKPAFPAPTLVDLMIFRWGRTAIKVELDDSSVDYRYWGSKGWFESDFYYPTRMGALMRGVGKLFDTISASLSRAR